MFRLASRYIPSTADSEDVLIMAFTKVYASIESFKDRGEGSLEGWIRKIVVNESLMWLRRRHNFNLTESIESDTDYVDLNDFSLLAPADIARFIAGLPNGYRTVFNLSVVEGYSHLEIADMLGISESTSRTQLFKAKTLLKKILTKEGFQYGT
jgi:RNA polymerase sigma-70 factor (ECF subfamily)